MSRTTDALLAGVDSRKHVPPYRSPPPVVRDLTCDHVTYFRTAARLRKLAETPAE